MDLCVKHYLNGRGMEPVGWSESAWHSGLHQPQRTGGGSRLGAKAPTEGRTADALCPALCLPASHFKPTRAGNRPTSRWGRLPVFPSEALWFLPLSFGTDLDRKPAPTRALTREEQFHSSVVEGRQPWGLRGSSEMIISPCSTGLCQLTLKGTSYLPQSWPPSCPTPPAACATGPEPFLTLSSLSIKAVLRLCCSLLWNRTVAVQKHQPLWLTTGIPLLTSQQKRPQGPPASHQFLVHSSGTCCPPGLTCSISMIRIHLCGKQLSGHIPSPVFKKNSVYSLPNYRYICQVEFQLHLTSISPIILQTWMSQEVLIHVSSLGKGFLGNPECHRYCNPFGPCQAPPSFQWQWPHSPHVGSFP